MIRFALPDGHQMRHVLNFFERIGIRFNGYEYDNVLSRRPQMEVISSAAMEIFNEPSMIDAKVIRPQDMPMQVAYNNFDIAITGVDWLTEHRLQFPLSPVKWLTGLGFGSVRIVAAIHESLPIYNINELKEFLDAFEPQDYFRIASEYSYIADDYAKRHNLYKYRIIMTYGATESLIPEDAEMIIENTETGNTLRRNHLRIIDNIFHSAGCLIVNEGSFDSGEKRDAIEALKRLFETGLKER